MIYKGTFGRNLKIYQNMCESVYLAVKRSILIELIHFVVTLVSTGRNQSYNKMYQLYQNRAFHGEINTFTHVLIYFRISAKSALIHHVLVCKYLLNTIFSHCIHANCARN